MSDFNDNVREFLARIPNPFALENVDDVVAEIQFQVDGPEGGDWYAEVKDGQAKLVEGTTLNPELVLRAGAEEVKALLSGTLDPFKAFMSGKVKVNGNMMLGLRLLKAIKLP